VGSVDGLRQSVGRKGRPSAVGAVGHTAVGHTGNIPQVSKSPHAPPIPHSSGGKRQRRGGSTSCDASVRSVEESNRDHEHPSTAEEGPNDSSTKPRRKATAKKATSICRTEEAVTAEPLLIFLPGAGGSFGRSHPNEYPAV
jgi:hypothetical protein